jgi:KDO2-lipid IV(A) lauroyltransferase
VQSLSLRQCDRLAEFLAFLAADVVRLRSDVVEDNLRHAYPDWSAARRRAVARGMWRHLILMIAEIAHSRRKLHASNWHRYIKFHRDDEMVRALLDDRPVVLVSGHFGNFELSSHLLGVFGFSTYAVARPLDNRFVDRYLKTFREALGQYILPKDDVAGRIAGLLADNEALAVLGDTHAIGKQGCWVDFFGRPASTHKAIAIFALGSDAPLLVCYSRRAGEPLVYEVGVADVFDPREAVAPQTVLDVTQWYTGKLEALIRTAPEQYWWLHRRWKGNPQGKTKRKTRRHAA